MENKNPKWVNVILNLKNSEGSTYFNLNDVAFERLKKCKKEGEELIPYRIARWKLCTTFCINKEQCMKLLRYFESVGKIKFGKRGIRVFE